MVERIDDMPAGTLGFRSDGELTDELLPAEPHDRPVDAVATPSGVVRLTGAVRGGG